MDTYDANMWWTRDDGAKVRVDKVGDEWVCFVSWRPGQELGCAKRMRPALFVEALHADGMRVATVDECEGE